LFIGKYEERIKEAKKYIFLKKLFSQKIITINNIQYKNLDFYISIIRNNNKLKSLLTPIMFGLIHGDLHCGNILIKSDNIYFVDPNGNLFMPLEYDYGKIFHSINGGYGSIMRKKFKLETKSINKYVFSLNLPKEYTYTFKQIVKEIPLDVFIKSFYSQAMHFATMIPHHAKDEKETTAIFLRSIQLFNELFKLVALTEQL